MTLNLLEAVRLEAPAARVLLASSGEVYGRPERLPVDEDAAAARPRTRTRSRRRPATCSRASTRTPRAARGPHACVQPRRAGPVATTTWSARSPARWRRPRPPAADEVRAAHGQPGLARATSRTCATWSARTSRRSELEPGVYNVASGRTASVRELIELLERGHAGPDSARDRPERVRPHDVPEVRGSAERLAEATGWAPEIPLEQTRGRRARRVARRAPVAALTYSASP